MGYGCDYGCGCCFVSGLMGERRCGLRLAVAGIRNPQHVQLTSESRSFVGRSTCYYFTQQTRGNMAEMLVRVM